MKDQSRGTDEHSSRETAPILARLLYISAQHPLIGSPGSKRLTRFLMHLPDHGWGATVLTQPILPWHYRPDTTYQEVFRAPHRVVSVPSIDLDNLLRFRRWIMGRVKGLVKRSANQRGDSSGANTIETTARFESFWNWFAVPDHTAGWGLTALPCGVCLALRSRAILATAPDWSNLLLGYDISRIARRPLVLDLRDPWSLGRLMPTSPKWRPGFDTGLEKRVFTHATTVILNTDRTREAYAEKYPELAHKFAVITNGYEPWAPGECPEHIDPGKFQLVHVGHMTTDTKNPTCLFEALREFLSICPEARDLLQVLIVGNLRADYHDTARRFEVDQYIHTIGAVPHKTALDYTSHAPILLLLGQMGKGDELIAHAKTYEYLASQRPIIATLPSEGANMDLLRKHDAGMVFEVTDPPAIARGLAKAFALWRKGELPTLESAPTYYSSVELTRRLADLLDSACGEAGE